MAAAVLKLLCYLGVLSLALSQAPIGFEDTCMNEQGVPDNLSCPDENGTLICYDRSELCNGVEFCADGSDEGKNLIALDCTGFYTGRTNGTIPAFVCSFGVIVELDQLCDGVNHCGQNGDDETTALCENKCLAPFYGSCPFTRECVVTDLDLNCGFCQPGWARDPSDLFGECLPAYFSFSQSAFSQREDLGPLIGSLTLTSNGVLETEVLIVVESLSSGDAAAGGDYVSLVTTVTFPRFSQGGTVIEFDVELIDDLIVENTESFFLFASIPSSSREGKFSEGGDLAEAFILDNDVLSSCQELKESRPHITCCSDDTEFCPIQCNQGACRCVDPLTGEVVGSGVFFYEDDPRIDCVEIFPEEPTTPPPTEPPTMDECDTSSSDSSKSGSSHSSSKSQSASNSQSQSAQSQSASNSHSDSGSDSQSQSGSNSKSKSASNSHSDSGSDSQSQSGYNSKSKSASNSHSDSDSDSQSQSDSNSKSKSASNSHSDSGSDSQSQSASNSQSQSAQSQSASNSHSDSGSDSQSQSGSNSKSKSASNSHSDFGSDSQSQSGSNSKSKSASNSHSDSGSDSSSACDTDGSSSGGSRPKKCSTTVRKLRKMGCRRRCIEEDSDGCPTCDQTCLGGNEEDPCGDCRENQICVNTGRFGRRSCVDALQEGERCDGERDNEENDEDDSEDSSQDTSSSGRQGGRGRRRGRARRRISGANDRRYCGQLREVTPPCGEGLVCTRVALGRRECRPENSAGVCVTARDANPELDCAADGSFEALQCREIDDINIFECRCVVPATGMTVSGTSVTVSDVADAPDCESMAYDQCFVEDGRFTYSVSHRDYFLDVVGCQRCLCDNGQATLCEPSVCRSLSATPTGCENEGVRYSHGEQFADDCNRCGCRNGRIECTRRRCEEAPVRDTCSTCDRFPRSPMCAPNGKTYQTECHALYCGGYPPFDLVEGPCAEYDVCERYPCPEGEKCLLRGGITCLDPDGCEPDELRLCIDLDSLQCEVPETEQAEVSDLSGDDGENSTVCGTNGETYSTLCELLQDTGNEGVAYAGECDREECDGGEVCGTDGVTYENICVLRSQSGNARLDYYGECAVDEDDPTDTPQAVCQRVSRARRCVYNASNCRRLVRPEEGCCALCGGVVLVAIDSRGLGEFVRLNPRVRSVDDFVELLIESGFISEELTERCEVGVSFSYTENLEISLEGRTEGDELFCGEASERLAEFINNPSAAETASVSRPQVLQFAGAAVSGTPTVEDMTVGGGSSGGGSSGANTLSVSVSVVFLSLVILLMTL